MLAISTMSAAIKSAFIATMGVPADAAQLQLFCDALATGLVPYLIAETVVLPGTFNVGGFGPVTGTGTVD